jgi:malonate decarboxylase delta subunit
VETLEFQRQTQQRAEGDRPNGLVGVVASGNLEVLLERVLDDTRCAVIIKTPLGGDEGIWRAVIDDFFTRFSPGGLRISVNDCGARPDTVSLRLAQGVRWMETEAVQ